MPKEKKAPKKVYDLEERTASFGEDTVRFAKRIPKNEITKPLIVQLIKCTSSAGANYAEADDAESKKDFKHKIGIAKKELRESKHFLRLIAVAVPSLKAETVPLLKEATELHLIFNAIYRKVS